EGRLHLGHAHRGDERLAQRLDDVGRYRRRRESGHPLRGAHAGESDLGKRGNIRVLREPLLSGNGERAHATRFHHPHRVGDVEPSHLGQFPHKTKTIGFWVTFWVTKICPTTRTDFSARSAAAAALRPL